jgi:hypothetical protein
MEPLEDETKDEMVPDYSKLTDEEWELFKKLNHKIRPQQDDKEAAV